MSTVVISVANLRAVVSRQHPRGSGYDLEVAADLGGGWYVLEVEDMTIEN